MPELPEVETIARTLEPLIQGAYIKEAYLHLNCTLDATGTGSLDLSLLKGREIECVRRRGKLLLINLRPITGTNDEAHILAIHLKMTGRVFVYDDTYPLQKHTRFHLLLEHNGLKKQLFFDDSRTFGYVRLISPNSLKTWPFWQNLGLEPLEHKANTLAQCYINKKAGIKSLLLNQSLVVGIGNIYADEALFKARISPKQRAVNINEHRLIELMQAVQKVLKLSIEQCGSSIRDYRDAHGDAGSFQNSFFVYGRSGENCKICNQKLHSERVAGRNTVWCENCQP